MTKHFIELRLGALQFARGATYLSLICVRLFQINSVIPRDGTQFDEITEWIFSPGRNYFCIFVFLMESNIRLFLGD